MRNLFTGAGWSLFLLSFAACNDAPEGGAIAINPATPTTVDDLMLDIVEDAVDGNSKDVVSYDIVWSADGQQVGELDGAQTVPSAQTAKGQVWTVFVTPKDDKASGLTLESSVTIVNTPPTITSGSVEPTAPVEGDDVTVELQTADVDDDTVDNSYVWFVGGRQAGGDSPTLSSDDFDKGDEIYVVVTPNDGEVDGETWTSDKIGAVNTAPSVTSAVIEPSKDVDESSLLACVGQGWNDVDGDEEGYEVEWKVNGVSAGPSETLSGDAFSKGDSVTCTLTPFDGEAAGEPVTSEAVVVINSAPVLEGLTLDPASPMEADTITPAVAKRDDLDGDTVTISFEWYVNKVAVTKGETLGGAYFDKGDEIYVVATPHDGDVAGDPLTSDVITAVNTPPVMDSLSLKGPITAATKSVTADAKASDADSDKISMKPTWYMAGKAQTEPSMTLSAPFKKGQEIYVQVVPNDGEDDGVMARSNVLKVGNTPPVVDSVAVTGPLYASTKTVAAKASGSDLDKDTLSWTYAWYLDGKRQSGASASIAMVLKRGNKVYVEATADDGDDKASKRSATLTVKNSLPVISKVTLTPSRPVEGNTVRPSVSASDVDKDKLKYTYQWYVNGKASSKATSLPSSLWRKNDKIYVDVVANDGFGDSKRVRSNTVTVANSAPTVSSVTISSPLNASTKSITSLAKATDVDGDRLSITYGWYIDGRKQSGTGPTLPVKLKKGQKVYVYGYANDGTVTASRQSRTVTVSNTPPTPVASMGITPKSPTASVNLVCNIFSGATDVDGDKLIYRFRWYRNNVLWTGKTGTTKYAKDTIYSADTRDAQSWKCVVDAHDGTSYGSSRQNTVKIISWPGKATFTDCGQSGQKGPSQAMCNAAYSKTPLSGKVKLSSSYQEWTVPATGTYRIETWGAEGGCFRTPSRGGNGARMRGDFKLTKGEILRITVGQRGVSRGFGGGGGGGSFVMKRARSVPLIIAGGGGGCGHSPTSGLHATTSSCGVSGGYSGAGRGGCSGLGGYSSSSYGGTYNNSGGGGGYRSGGSGNGTRTNPGASWLSGAYGGANTGGFGGGGGGISHAWNCSTGNGGGSGGGGYSGGGGGGGTCNGPGGGGGSYNVGSSRSNTSGVKTGDGQVTIDLL